MANAYRLSPIMNTAFFPNERFMYTIIGNKITLNVHNFLTLFSRGLDVELKVTIIEDDLKGILFDYKEPRAGEKRKIFDIIITRDLHPSILLKNDYNGNTIFLVVPGTSLTNDKTERLEKMYRIYVKNGFLKAIIFRQDKEAIIDYKHYFDGAFTWNDDVKDFFSLPFSIQKERNVKFYKKVPENVEEMMEAIKEDVEDLKEMINEISRR